jgi:hypothetical protein
MTVSLQVQGVNSEQTGEGHDIADLSPFIKKVLLKSLPVGESLRFRCPN